MEIRELRSFCTAAKLKSISKAADHLGIGQPTVTTHIKKLEDELQTALFDRAKRPIRLTSSGKTLARLATPLVEGIDSLATKTSDGVEHGPVAVASTPDTAQHALLRVVRAFMARHPHVRLQIRSGIRAEVIRMVAEGEVDVGVIPHVVVGEEFNFEGLFLYERVLITPKGHPLLGEELTSLDQIARWPLILTTQGTHTRKILEDEFARRGVGYEIAMELDSVDMIKRYVALGLGVAVGPRFAIEPQDYDELAVVSLANLLPVDQAGIVTLRNKSLSVPVRNFISVMRDVLSVSGTGLATEAGSGR